MNAGALQGHPHPLAARPRVDSRRAATRSLALLLTLTLALAAWWLLAPPALGGSTSVAIVDGTSMLPRLHGNDLVLVRASSHYAVGDVVAYRSALLHLVVLHRIVAISDGRYTFKGDHNTWTDPEKPRRGDLIGKRWIRIGHGGHVAAALRSPPIAAALAGLLVLVFGLSGARPARR